MFESRPLLKDSSQRLSSSWRTVISWIFSKLLPVAFGFILAQVIYPNAIPSPFLRSPAVVGVTLDPAVQAPEIDFLFDETILPNNALRYTRMKPDAHPETLWLAMTYDNTSWGKVPNGGGMRRTIDDLHDIISEQLDNNDVSLGLLTSSMDEYESYKQSIASLAYPRVIIYLQPGFHDGPVVDRAHRHDAEVQAQRRGEMAKLRNFLMLGALADETHIVWSDADVHHFDAGVTAKMIHHACDQDEYGIFTVRCERGGNRNYDLNAWQGSRRKKVDGDGKNDKVISDNSFISQNSKVVLELVKDTTDDDIVPLDAVGATLLYISAGLVRKGVNFPHQYTTGVTWDNDGDDGIESEGLCLRARGLKGGRCGLLGGSWKVKHM